MSWSSTSRMFPVDRFHAYSSPATVRTYRQILGQVLNQAVADDLIQANPVEKVKAPTVRPRRQLFLTASELEMLAEASGDYGPLAWFLEWSGLRFGEAAALRTITGNPPDLITEIHHP